MAEALTKRHSQLLARGWVSPLAFARDVFRHGKLAELASFMVWELLHRMRLFPAGKYLRFDDTEALQLNRSSLDDDGEKIVQFLRGRNLSATFAGHCWQRLFVAADGELFGAMEPDCRSLYSCTNGNRSPSLRWEFPEEIKSTFVSSTNTVFVCAKGAVYRSPDGGVTFARCLRLSTPLSFFRHNNGITETPSGTLLIGEYGNVWDKTGWRNLAYLFSSVDDGLTWKRSAFLTRRRGVKHIHLVKYSERLRKLLMADGDGRKTLWIGDPDVSGRDVNWKRVNRWHLQVGGYTSMVEADGKILLGTDYKGGTNFLVGTTDGESFEKRIVPDPYRRSPIYNMVARRSRTGSEIWANLHFGTATRRCLLMKSCDGGRSWTRVIQWRAGTHAVALISSSTEMAEELYLSVEDLRSAERVVFRVADP